MAIFISYSHADKKFVDRLAIELVRARAPIWLDRWELKVGDSLIQRIQTAIQGAGALLVILSKTSVESEWCKKELSAGLVRELEEKRVLVLPVIIEDCEVPLFLREKVFADFRSNYDEGLGQLLRSIAGLITDLRGRATGPDMNVDWAIDWSITAHELIVVLTMLQHSPTTPYTVLVQLELTGNQAMRRRFVRYAKHGLDWLYRQVIIEMLREFAEKNDIRLLLADPQPVRRTLRILDKNTGISVDIVVVGRIMGEDTGVDVLLDMTHQFEAILQSMRLNTRPPTPEERSTATRIAAELMIGRRGK